MLCNPVTDSIGSTTSSPMTPMGFFLRPFVSQLVWLGPLSSFESCSIGLNAYFRVCYALPPYSCQVENFVSSKCRCCAMGLPQNDRRRKPISPLQCVALRDSLYKNQSLSKMSRRSLIYRRSGYGCGDRFMSS